MNEAVTPEDLKIREYERGVETLLAEVSALEEAVESAAAALLAFQRLHFARISGLFLFNDMMRAVLASEDARQTPEDARKAAAAREAEEQERQAREEAGQEIRAPAPITPELKSAFRETIRAIHPDRAVDEQDRARRTELTQKLNDAYRNGDLAGVKAIMREFQLSKMPDDAGKRLVILIRQEFDLKKRIEKLKKDLVEVEASEMSELKRSHDEASARGADAFAEIRQGMLKEIADNASRIAEIGFVPTSFRKISPL